MREAFWEQRVPSGLGSPRNSGIVGSGCAVTVAAGALRIPSSVTAGGRQWAEFTAGASFAAQMWQSEWSKAV